MSRYDSRYLSFPCEVREASSPDSIGMLVGTAVVFDAESEDLGGFVETIDPRALDGVMASDPDVRAFWNHDTGSLLARTIAGTLRLRLDAKSLRYEIDLPDTSAGRDVLTLARRGDLRENSFGFDVDIDGDEWSRRDDGMRMRRLKRISRLYEVSPVSIPAYPQTSLAVRSLERWERESVRRHYTTLSPRR
jgi:hypothetical protein